MSGTGMFDGLGGMLEQPSDEGYEPGQSVDQELVKTLLEPLVNPWPKTNYREPDALEKDFHARVGRASELLRDEDVPDANALIEQVLLGTTRYIEKMPCGCMEDIIGPLLQALYDSGHNNFFVDYHLLERPEQEFDPTRRLAGTAKRPLRATLAAPRIGWFGAYARHCRLSLRGDAEMAGPYAKNSEFEIGGSMMLVGEGAESCIFRAKRLKKCDRFGPNVHYRARRCKLYFEEEPDNSGLWDLECQEFFFWHGDWQNRLYVYKGEETRRFLWKTWKRERWTEVRP